MSEKPGRRKTIAVRMLELAMALPPGDALPDTPELARQLDVGETTVYQVRSALTVRGELLDTDHGWRLSPQQRLASQQSVTRALSGHWLCCLPVGTRTRYFVVDVTQKREVAVFAANAGGEYSGPWRGGIGSRRGPCRGGWGFLHGDPRCRGRLPTSTLDKETDSRCACPQVAESADHHGLRRWAGAGGPGLVRLLGGWPVGGVRPRSPCDRGRR